jgi:hypothetical protein
MFFLATSEYLIGLSRVMILDRAIFLPALTYQEVGQLKYATCYPF